MKAQELSQDRLSCPLHFFNISGERVELDGPSESGSTHFWSTAGSLLNIVEHGKPPLCTEKSNLPWNWKVGAEQPGPKGELHDEFCSFKTYWCGILQMDCISLLNSALVSGY